MNKHKSPIDGNLGLVNWRVLGGRAGVPKGDHIYV